MPMADRSEIREDAERALAGWRPIETAPKDGTPILLGWPADGPELDIWRQAPVVIGHYSPSRGCWVSISLVIEWWIENKMSGNDLSYLFDERDEPPTHWQPLPLPPRPTTASHSPHPLKADPSNTGTD